MHSANSILAQTILEHNPKIIESIWDQISEDTCGPSSSMIERASKTRESFFEILMKQLENVMDQEIVSAIKNFHKSKGFESQFSFEDLQSFRTNRFVSSAKFDDKKFDSIVTITSGRVCSFSWSKLIRLSLIIFWNNWVWIHSHTVANVSDHNTLAILVRSFFLQSIRLGIS